MKRSFWFFAFPFVFWPCTAYAVWRIYGMIVHHDSAYMPDIIKLVGFLIAAYVANAQARRKFEDKQRDLRGLHEFAAEQDRIDADRT